MVERVILPEPLGVNIERLIVALQTPLTSEEASAGWNQSLKTRWAGWFVNFRAQLECGNQTPPGWGILRAMDFDGVSDSALAKQASTVGHLVDEWKPPT